MRKTLNEYKNCYLVREILTDGSEVFDLVLKHPTETIKLVCHSENHAIEVARAVDSCVEIV
ncbi:unnamed protein product [marine sediment metagenome]|uniref:Uncharacterized protein n=1 Tax=marine sediment metagenome TaxID=412755 RepID=X0ZAM7_9ZZZZ